MYFLSYIDIRYLPYPFVVRQNKPELSKELSISAGIFKYVLPDNLLQIEYFYDAFFNTLKD